MSSFVYPSFNQLSPISHHGNQWQCRDLNGNEQHRSRER
jgi:hypothetical protein